MVTGRRTLDKLQFSLSISTAIFICSTIIGTVWYASSWAGGQASDIQVLRREQQALKRQHQLLEESYRRLSASNDSTISSQRVIEAQIAETRKSIDRIERSIDRLTDIVLEDRRGREPP